MNEDLDGDEAMKNFEDLGRKIFQSQKPEIKEDDTEELTEEEPQDDE